MNKKLGLGIIAASMMCLSGCMMIDIPTQKGYKIQVPVFKVTEREADTRDGESTGMASGSESTPASPVSVSAPAAQPDPATPTPTPDSGKGKGHSCTGKQGKGHGSHGQGKGLGHK